MGKAVPVARAAVFFNSSLGFLSHCVERQMTLGHAAVRAVTGNTPLQQWHFNILHNLMSYRMENKIKGGRDTYRIIV